MRFAVILMAASIASMIATVAYGQDAASIAEDIQSVDRDISEAQTALSRFEGGAIKGIIAMRVEILKNTRAMLNQKQSAWIRFIALNYTIDGKAPSPTSSETLTSLERDIAATQKRISLEEKEASKYSGGLVQAMKMVSIETEKASLAMLRLRHHSMHYGIPIYGIAEHQAGATAKPPQEKLGRPVPDKDALQ